MNKLVLLQSQRIAILTFVALLLVIVGVINISQAREDLLIVYGAFLLYSATLIMPVALKWDKSLGLFHPVVFFGLWEFLNISVRELSVYAYGLPWHLGIPGMGREELSVVIGKTCALEMIGFLSFIFASILVKVPAEIPLPNGSLKVSILRISVICVLSGISLWYFAKQVGGIESLLLMRGVARAERVWEDVGRHWVVPIAAAKYAVLIWLGVRRSTVFNIGFWLIATFALVLEFIATGSRSAVVIPIMMGTCIWFVRRESISLTVPIVVGALALLFIGIAGEFRRETRETRDLGAITLEGSTIDFVSFGIADATARGSVAAAPYAILALVPEVVPHLGGESYLAMLAAPIPRTIWPGKPIGVDLMAGKTFFGNEAGMPTGQMGEAFWNWSILGVVVVYALHGLIMANAYKIFLQGGRHPCIMVLYIVSLFQFGVSTSHFNIWVRSTFAILIAGVILFGFGWIRQFVPQAKDISLRH